MANSNSQPANPVLIIRLRKSAVGKKENGAFTTRHHPVGLATDVATANAVCKDMNAHKESEKDNFTILDVPVFNDFKAYQADVASKRDEVEAVERNMAIYRMAAKRRKLLGLPAPDLALLRKHNKVKS